MNLYQEAMGKSFLEHSAKGQSWGKHKYIAIKNGRYIYPEDVQKSGGQSSGMNVSANKRIEARNKYLSDHSGKREERRGMITTGSAAQIEAAKRKAQSNTRMYFKDGPGVAGTDAMDKAMADTARRKQMASPEYRSRQINDQINSAHSNATSSKMDLTPGSELKKRAEERKASTASTASAETSKIVEEIKRRNSSPEKKAEEPKKEETNETATSTSASTTEETKSGSGKGRKGSGSKKSSKSTDDKKATAANQTATTLNTPEAQQLGITEDDFKALGLTEPVATRDEAIEKLAMKVIHGDFGNGADRKTKLGKFYDEVQKKVNELMKQMKSGSSTVKHSNYAMDVLAHHGIKGMKWGIRRFQPYPSGHTGGTEVGEAAKARKGRKKLTSEQKEKLKTVGAAVGAAATVAGSAAGAAKLYKMDKAKSQNVKNLSTEDIQASNKRAGLERQYLKDQGKSNLEKAQYGVNEANRAINQLKNKNRQAMNDARRNRPRMDLSNMTDQQLRERINRENLERQYNDLFAPPYVDKGKERVDKILDAGGDVLSIAGSALGIAVAIKMLKGKG